MECKYPKMGYLAREIICICLMAKSIFSARQEKLQRLLKDARSGAGLTQEALAKKLDRPQSFVSKYESGERRLDLVELQDVCRGIGISLNDFVRRFE
jgi:ribosome-binding protein aMBF1 (putative translation factor)